MLQAVLKLGDVGIRKSVADAARWARRMARLGVPLEAGTSVSGELAVLTGPTSRGLGPAPESARSIEH